MGSRLVFSPGQHSYSLDGRRVPSVSAVKNVLDSPALVWAATKEAAGYAATHLDDYAVLGDARWRREVAGAHQTVWNKKRDAGTAVHDIARRAVYGEPVEAYDPDTGEEYHPDVIRMGEQAARFMDTWDVTPDTALVERPVFHETERYAGTFDLQAVVKGGERWLIDYKTGGTGVYPETALQLTAYSRATHVQLDRGGELLDMKMHPTNRCVALWIRPDAWEVLPVKSDQQAWDTFRYLLRVLPWVRLPRDEVIGAPMPGPEAAA